jgi:hypothetical protein
MKEKTICKRLLKALVVSGGVMFLKKRTAD